MKNFLLKIIFAGLTMGIVPQSTFAMETLNTTREKVLSYIKMPFNKINNTMDKINNTMDKANKFMQEHYIIVLLLMLAFFAYDSQNDNGLYAQYKKQKAQLDLHRANLENNGYGYFPLQTYAHSLGIGENAFSHKEMNSFRISQKHGKIIIPSQQLQSSSYNGKNFTFIQQLSVQQDGPTCAKYAFSNLFAIEQLYRNGKTINDENIRDLIKLPLETMGFTGQPEWKPLKKMLNLVSGEVPGLEQQNWISNYARVFFPDNNIHPIFFIPPTPAGMPPKEELATLEKPLRDIFDIDKAIDGIVHDLKTYGISHILSMCGMHATSFSIIKNGENDYLVIYMDSNNVSLSTVHHQLVYPVPACYDLFQTMLSNLKDMIERKLIANK